MTFVATFLDGPMEHSQHDFLGADEPFTDLYAMPNPSDAEAPWLIVGYTGLEPEHPWPNQVHYRLLTTELLDEPVGRYTLAAR
jgi:hypothetical protein